MEQNHMSGRPCTISALSLRHHCAITAPSLLQVQGSDALSQSGFDTLYSIQGQRLAGCTITAVEVHMSDRMGVST